MMLMIFHMGNYSFGRMVLFSKFNSKNELINLTVTDGFDCDILLQLLQRRTETPSLEILTLNEAYFQ